MGLQEQQKDHTKQNTLNNDLNYNWLQTFQLNYSNESLFWIKFILQNVLNWFLILKLKHSSKTCTVMNDAKWFVVGFFSLFNYCSEESDRTLSILHFSLGIEIRPK